jgi:hypothetical protein
VNCNPETPPTQLWKIKIFNSFHWKLIASCFQWKRDSDRKILTAMVYFRYAFSA